MANSYDIQKNAAMLVDHLCAADLYRMRIVRQAGYFLELSLNDARLDLDYMGEGVWGIDPVFTSSMVCYLENKRLYARVCALLSEFNVKSHNRYNKTGLRSRSWHE
jgi:hypothetical protein